MKRSFHAIAKFARAIDLMGDILRHARDGTPGEQLDAHGVEFHCDLPEPPPRVRLVASGFEPRSLSLKLTDGCGQTTCLIVRRRWQGSDAGSHVLRQGNHGRNRTRRR